MNAEGDQGNAPKRAVGRASGRQRALAVLSLCAAVTLLAALVVFVVRNGGYVVVALAGFVLSVGGGWGLIAGRGVRRIIGLVMLLAGLAVGLAAIVGAASGTDAIILHGVLFVGLVALTFGSARLALRHDVGELNRLDHRVTHAPRHPVLICNPWSGGGKVEKFGLVELAQDLGVETVLLDHGLDLEQLARDAIARGADCLGMAGGDGSQALVASIAVEHDLPFVCVTAGTRNHFALDLGLDRDDPRRSLYAFGDAVERRIDFATVNGRFFVNNVSLGVYATIVQQDQYREEKVETTKALLPELLGRADHPFDLEFTGPDGTEVVGPYLIQVSNNPYVLGASLDVSQRRRLDTGRLGVFAVTGKSGADAGALVTLSALGQRRLSPNWHEFVTEEFEVRSRSGKAYAGVDGEALEMDTPLSFSIHPGGLRILMPEGNLVAADRRRARQVSVHDLVSLARGSDPSGSDLGRPDQPG